ncbi:MAG: hypothetical protein ACE5H2_05395 [Terriglobia bacterium]
MANDARQVLEQALTQAIASIQRQLGEVQNSYDAVQRALQESSGDRLGALLPALLQLEATGAALAASIEAVLRFAGSSLRWMSAPPVAASAAAPSVVAEPPPPAAAPAAEPEVEEVEAAAAVEAAPAAAPAAEAPPAAAPAVEAPPPTRRLSEVEIAQLPDELRQLHKKAKRFARVTVQEFVMYKKDEVEKGRTDKDLYERFRDEIDKSKALYDQRFVKIAEHNIDYLYEEMVRVLAKDDPSALGKYPHPVPPRD